MELCKNCKNRISYSEFLEYLDSGRWALSVGIDDIMTKEEHLSYIDSITSFEDAIIEFVPDDTIPELCERIDVFIMPTNREPDKSSNSKHIQFTKQTKNKKNLNKFLLLIILSLFVLTSKGQRVGSISKLGIKGYFEANHEDLDEIEGIYDCSFIPYYIGGNLLFGQKTWGGQEFHTEAYIWKLIDGYWLELQDKTIKMSSGTGYIMNLGLVPLGDTNVYRLTGKFEESYNHFGNSGKVEFKISTRATFSQNVLSFRFKGGDSFHIIEVVMSLVKIFPTHKPKAKVAPSQPTNWTGTGFTLNNRYVVTNYHVVENAKSITLTGINGNFGTKISATIVAKDQKNDLALLKLNGNFNITNIPYSVKSTTSDVGEEVFVLGYPLTSTMGNEIKLTTGVISSKSGFQGDISQYQISAPIQPGNSGGPLFDSKGNIIGIVSAKHVGAENVGYAIKTSYLKSLVESVTSASVLPQTNRVANQNLSGKVKAVKNYVYYITCSK